MMSKTKNALFMGIGILAGLALSGPATQAATAALTASPTSQTFYVNGQRVEFEAYEIHGNNFVKLRDIGQAVDFGVTYDAAADSVYIDPNARYHEETLEPEPTPTPSATGEYAISADHWSREDFSRQANPAVFTGVYDRALYNTIRQTMVDGGEVGDSPAYTMVGPWEDYSAVKNLLGRLEGVLRYEHYVPRNFPNYWQHLDYFAVSAAMPENYREPYDFIQPIIAEVAKMGTDREKVTHLNDYLGSLLTYKKGETAGLARTFSQHTGELEAACGSYARAFKFLCAAADIPCFTVSTSDHTWNLVYADGRWLHVDAAANDLYRNHSVLLTETYPGHTDIAPEQTAFLKELLVPGSTK